MSLFHTPNIVKRLITKINQKGLSIYMYSQSIGIYPLLGSHSCAIHFKQDVSNLFSSYSHNTSQIKCNWGLNVPFWSRIRLYLIVHTIKLLAVSFYCLHFARFYTRTFIFWLLALWLVGFQVSLCLPVGDPFPGSYIVTSGCAYKVVIVGGYHCLLAASWYIMSCPICRSCEGKYSFLLTFLSFSGCKPSCCLAA